MNITYSDFETTEQLNIISNSDFETIIEFPENAATWCVVPNDYEGYDTYCGTESECLNFAKKNMEEGNFAKAKICKMTVDKNGCADYCLGMIYIN